MEMGELGIVSYGEIFMPHRGRLRFDSNYVRYGVRSAVLLGEQGQRHSRGERSRAIGGIPLSVVKTCRSSRSLRCRRIPPAMSQHPRREMKSSSASGRVGAVRVVG